MSRRFERLYQNLQAARVPGQLEQPHYADDGEELEDIVLLLQLGQQEVEVEAQRGHHVDDVYGRFDEVEFVVGHDEADDDLEGEPSVASAFEVEESHVGFRTLLNHLPEQRLHSGWAGR